MYVPTSENEIVLVTNNCAALDGFIESESSFSDARGEGVERNAAWGLCVNFLDVRLAQEIGTVRGQRVEIMANVLNVLNEVWGKVQYAVNNNYRLLDFCDYIV